MITSSRSPISPTSVVEVVEHPRRVERVHARPQRGAAEVDLAADPHEPLARGLLAVDRDGVLEVAEQDVGRRARCPAASPPSSRSTGRRSGSSATGVTGISSSGSGAPSASGLAKERGLRIQAHRTGAPASMAPYDHAFVRDRPGRPRGERRPPVRPLPRGVRGRRGLQALAGEDGDRGRRPPVLPDHHEPPPAAHQRRLRRRSPSRAATSSSARSSTRSRSA